MVKFLNRDNKIEDLITDAGGQISVVDMGRPGEPITQLRQNEGKLQILGGDGQYHDIDPKYAQRFYNRAQMKELVASTTGERR